MTARAAQFRHTGVAAGAVFVFSVIAGCATPPPSPAPAIPEAVVPAPDTPSLAEQAERVLRERAEAHTHARRFADALVQWEILALLRPDMAEYRDQIGQTRRQISETAQAALAAAEQAHRSGNLDRAATEYLRVLSVDRNNARAAQGLREIERERTRRNYLNRAPRLVL